MINDSQKKLLILANEFYGMRYDVIALNINFLGNNVGFFQLAITKIYAALQELELVIEGVESSGYMIRYDSNEYYRIVRKFGIVGGLIKLLNYRVWPDNKM